MRNRIPGRRHAESRRTPAARSPDAGVVARDHIQRLQSLRSRFFRPDHSHHRVVGAGDRKPARLSRTRFRHHLDTGLRGLRVLQIVRRHEHVGCRSGNMATGVDGWRLLSLQPLQCCSFDPAFPPYRPCANQSREHSIRLRRPVRYVAGRPDDRTTNAGQELDLEDRLTRRHLPRRQRLRGPARGCAERCRSACPAASV